MAGIFAGMRSTLSAPVTSAGTWRPKRWDAVIVDGHPPARGYVVRVYSDTQQALVKAGLTEGLFPWHALAPAPIDEDGDGDEG